ncbi:MAG: glycosyltransferase family 2 protein, partial [Anaerolineae bacterium]
MSEVVDLSVVIVSWNVKTLLEKCLRSLSSAPGWTLVAPDDEPAGARTMEIWVVDSASSDGSADMVQEMFPRVGLIA